MSHNNSTSGSIQSFLLGALVGGTIGAALAMLYAPKKGSDLREDIASTVGDLRNEVLSALKKAKVSTIDLINEGKERGDQLVQDAFGKAGHLIDEADRIISDAKSQFHS